MADLFPELDGNREFDGSDNDDLYEDLIQVEHPDDEEIIETHTKHKKGFFKLIGDGWNIVIPQMTITLGRNTPTTQVDVNLGKSTLISRYLFNLLGLLTLSENMPKFISTGTLITS